MLTLGDVIYRLQRIDEVSLLEVLNIDSEDITERFLDRIEVQYERLAEELKDNVDE